MTMSMLQSVWPGERFLDVSPVSNSDSDLFGKCQKQEFTNVTTLHQEYSNSIIQYPSQTLFSGKVSIVLSSSHYKFT